MAIAPCAAVLAALLASVPEADPTAALADPPAAAVATNGEALSVRSRATTAVPGRVLDLAFVGTDRILVLLDGALALYRYEADRGFARLHEVPLPVTSPVRAPAGMLVASPAEKAAWLATNRAPGAALFSVDGDRLAEVERASALPWKDSPRGAAFHRGTNLIDAPLGGLGDGPHLRFGASPQPWAVAGDGRLGTADTGWTESRVGSAVAPLWPGAFIASSPRPPGAGDALSVVTLLANGNVGCMLATNVVGTVRAVAARTSGQEAHVVAAIDVDGAGLLSSMEVSLVPSR